MAKEKIQDAVAPAELTFNNAPLSAYRVAASALLTYAVSENGAQGPVYMRVVEGRKAPKYSSCGDLAHWLLYRLGVRLPWINRSEFTRDASGFGWRVGLNLNLLAAPEVGSNTCAVPARKLTTIPELAAGDLLQVSTESGGHEICVTGRTSDVIQTAEYGQPGGLAKSHALTLHKPTGLVFCGQSQVTHVLPLASVLVAARNAAALAPVDLTWLDEATRKLFTRPAG